MELFEPSFTYLCIPPFIFEVYFGILPLFFPEMTVKCVKKWVKDREMGWGQENYMLDLDLDTSGYVGT